jgi:hypothetical protein
MLELADEMKHTVGDHGDALRAQRAAMVRSHGVQHRRRADGHARSQQVHEDVVQNGARLQKTNTNGRQKGRKTRKQMTYQVQQPKRVGKCHRQPIRNTRAMVSNNESNSADRVGRTRLGCGGLKGR